VEVDESARKECDALGRVEAELNRQCMEENWFFLKGWVQLSELQN
jgi:hypothetical protein